jgi:hypothetical protein
MPNRSYCTTDQTRTKQAAAVKHPRDKESQAEQVELGPPPLLNTDVTPLRPTAAAHPPQQECGACWIWSQERGSCVAQLTAVWARSLPTSAYSLSPAAPAF